ncbi:hypothetical protein [Agrobacterium rosae]
MHKMTEIIKARLGEMLMSICEAETLISQKDARIAELEEALKIQSGNNRLERSSPRNAR